MGSKHISQQHLEHSLYRNEHIVSYIAIKDSNSFNRRFSPISSGCWLQKLSMNMQMFEVTAALFHVPSPPTGLQVNLSILLMKHVKRFVLQNAKYSRLIKAQRRSALLPGTTWLSRMSPQPHQCLPAPRCQQCHKSNLKNLCLPLTLVSTNNLFVKMLSIDQGSSIGSRCDSFMASSAFFLGCAQGWPSANHCCIQLIYQKNIKEPFARMC